MHPIFEFLFFQCPQNTLCCLGDIELETVRVTVTDRGNFTVEYKSDMSYYIRGYTGNQNTRPNLIISITNIVHFVLLNYRCKDTRGIVQQYLRWIPRLLHKKSSIGKRTDNGKKKKSSDVFFIYKFKNFLKVSRFKKWISIYLYPPTPVWSLHIFHNLPLGLTVWNRKKICTEKFSVLNFW